MARPAKIEVSAINIRIPSEFPRDYANLIARLAELKVGVRVYAEKYVAISQFDPETGMGVFSKYSEIDVDGEWFDIRDFDVASQDALGEITIPDNLRPNHTAFYFKLHQHDHVIAFETYSESKTLSTKSVEKYFREMLDRDEIYLNFGRVEADIIQSYEFVDEIMSLPNLKEIEIVIRRPNTDGVSGDWAKKIEERLKEQKGEEYSEGLKSKDADGLVPNERTKILAQVAAENGYVKAKNVQNGLTLFHETNETPLKVADTYTRDDTPTRNMFLRLSARILERIRAHRAQLLSGE